MRKQQNFQWNKIQLGTCYYPEQWDRSFWKEDLIRMLEAGIQTVRIGEFAWSILEPHEGEFSFELFDAFLDIAEETEMKVIFGTPSATPPAWLTEKYPEVLNARIDGVLFRHGMRRHYNYNSPKYQELAARIADKIAEHYAKRPCIIGWQIDNELNCETDEFYSESDSIAFRRFLSEKYLTLDRLNEAWGTVVWSQTYSSWDEIFVPRPTVRCSENPHLKLDYSRFISDSAIRWCRMQYNILKQHIKSGDFITTNGLFSRLDNHTMQDTALDVYTYDSYPNFAWCLREDPLRSRGLNDRKWSAHLTEVRSICPHFGIMEQQSGANGWTTCMEAPAPKPGQLTLWAMQSIAHGADYVSFFRWRTATKGTEIYWHGILDYDNRDNRKLREVRALGDLLPRLCEVTNADFAADAAIVMDYDNIWDAELDQWHRRLAHESEKEIFIAAQNSHTPIDYLFLLDETEPAELAKYKLLFYPHPLIMTERRAALLKSYVEQGGILILGARTGMKDITGQCVMQPMPGLLADLTGSRTDDFTFIGPGDEMQTMEWCGEVLSTGIFSDILDITSETAKVLAVYGKDYYQGRPVLIESACGKGTTIHFGGTFTRENTLAMLKYTHCAEPHSNTIRLPECCELAVREKNGVIYYFVLNYSPEQQSVLLHKKLTDLYSGETVCGEVSIPPYGTRVYRQASGEGTGV